MAPDAVTVLRALADPTRLRMLSLLRRGELCVGDLQAILRIPQAKTSRHLARLLEAGLVLRRVAGLWAFYRLSAPRDAFHARLLDCLAAAAGALPEAAADLRRSRSLRSCCPAARRRS